MIEVMNQKGSIALRTIVQLNPFDAVVILKKQKDAFYVEMVNSRATILFQTQYETRMLATSFLGQQNWTQLESYIEQATGENVMFTLNQQLVECVVQTINTADGLYYCVIFRVESKKAYEALEEKESKMKHLYFLEQYVDPVISLDLEGTIIYMNKAAERKLAYTNGSLIGESIFELVATTDKESFVELFERTLKGSPMGLPKIELVNEYFKEEPVYVNSFPTYWDGQVIGVHIVIKNIEELFNDRDAYKYVTYYDELTRLYNRRALNDHWQSILKKKERLNYALVLVDLDRFKRFNESLGKKNADIILAIISERFHKLRDVNCEIYRYNGDEFVFLIAYEQLEQVENRYIKHIFEEIHEPILFEEHEYYITASIGVALSKNQQELGLDCLLHQADKALFHVKMTGRGHFKYYDESMSKAFPNAALMETHLKRAIEFDELKIYFQPQLDLTTGTVNSFEALLRWENRKFGHVSPTQFIPIAESSGIIVEIGDWVLDQACQYLKEWQQQNLKPVRIAVNISPVQFRQPDFVLKVRNLVEQYGIQPDLLELEITETSMSDLQETTKTLKALKEIGVFVAVDDFGTGYSSLSYLKMFPVDVIKIDQSFIADISKNTKNEAIIEAIVAMSHSLGLEVIAEGVEELMQEDFLRGLQCQKVQGYLYNRPLPADEAIQKYMRS